MSVGVLILDSDFIFVIYAMCALPIISHACIEKAIEQPYNRSRQGSIYLVYGLVDWCI